jgi:DNA-binding winged helix-turn-helix (wHTH) protein/tetratricopeptide (TPR) repeat protein
VAQTVFRFGPFVLDTGAYRLSRSGAAVDLTPKAFELLRSLVEHAGTLVTKEELFTTIWPGVAVTDNALTQVVSDLRQALGDSSAAPEYVQTVARRGYRFVAEVAAGDTERSAPPRPPEREHGTSRPVLVVADFQNVARDADLDWLSSGIAETVTGALGVRPDIRVQDRARLLNLGDRFASPLDLARAAGATLLVTGAFQHAAGQLRLTARLIDVGTGDVRGDARADGTIRDIFVLQDDLARQLSATLGGGRPEGPLRRARHTANLEAYRSAVEGRLVLESLDPEEVPEALARFSTAIELDPGYAAAHVGLANARGYLYERTRYRPDRRPDLLRQAIESARRAIALDDGYAEAHATLSFLLVSAGDRDEGRRAAMKAVALEPDEWMHRFRLGHASWGTARLEALSRALSSFPEFPFAYFQRAMVFIARGSLDRAAAALEEGLRVVRDDGHRRFPGAGLRWLLGMTALAGGNPDDATRLLEAELQSRQSTLYSEEFAVAARLGIGFVQLSTRRVPEAAQTFSPLVACDGSGRALLGLAMAARLASMPELAREPIARLERAAAAEREAGRTESAAMLDAATSAAQGDDEGALDRLDAVMQTAPPGPLGWALPIDPVFSSLRGTPRMAAILSALSARAV